ncbi:MAG TPA: tetratricopeptide repeat protein [Terriglobia bacterium]|nr:tetratricopeptide repeat protein [Terriglobia bacterium]
MQVEQIGQAGQTAEYRLTRISTIEPRWRKAAATAAAALIILAAPVHAPAQQASNVSLEANEQIFCVMAAINAAGYDAGLAVESGDRTRVEVRALLASGKFQVLPELRRFYAEHQVAGDPSADLGQYLSLALLLGPPPDFRPSVPEKDLPPDAKSVAELIPLLKRFYTQANLGDLWTRVQPAYENQVERYSAPVREAVTLSDAYLRSPSGAYLGRNYNIDLNLLATPNQAQARIYGSTYYLMVSPSQELRIAEIRHQYLHFLIDALALKYAGEVHEKSGLAAIARKAPALNSDFRNDFSLLLTECLIRAVELKMDKRPKAEAEKAVADLAAAGLILAPYFYEELAVYERQDAPMSVDYRRMVVGIDLKDEAERLAKVKFAPAPAPAAAPSPALSAEDRLIEQGDDLIFQSRYAEAKSVFEDVLKTDSKNERALYGMAVAESNTRKPDLAREYFQKTLAAARDARLVTWSHVYLGRIDDLEGKRNQALDEYRSAAVTAGAYPDALQAVQTGLAKPFGSK